MSQEDNEILDLVDNDDQVIGTIVRNDAMSLPPEGSRFIRGVSVVVTDGSGRVWTPIRNTNKSIAPGGYDNSAEGHLSVGETYEQCAVRELREETGIDATIDDLELRYYGKHPGIPYIFKFFLLQTTQQPALSDEHTSGKWLTPQQIMDAINSGKSAKDTVSFAVSLLIEKRKV